jgi:hypothetical protein
MPTQTDSMSKFFPHCIPPRLVSSVVSSWSSFRLQSILRKCGLLFCIAWHVCSLSLLLFYLMLSAVILFRFPFHYCQKRVFVRTFFLFISRPSHSLCFRHHSLCYSLMDLSSLILQCIVMYFGFMLFVLKFEKIVLWPCIASKKRICKRQFISNVAWRLWQLPRITGSTGSNWDQMRGQIYSWVTTFIKQCHGS